MLVKASLFHNWQNDEALVLYLMNRTIKNSNKHLHENYFIRFIFLAFKLITIQIIVISRESSDNFQQKYSII